MKQQWLAIEHYRLHSVEEWPDGPHKEAELAAIRSTLQSLSGSGTNAASSDCFICRSRANSKPLATPPLAA